MPTLTITKNWDDGTVLTESQLDDIKTSVETFINTTKIDTDNIQSGGIATTNYAAGSVDATALGTSSVTTVKINDAAVTTVKLLDANVTQAKLAARVTGTSVAAGGIAVSASSASFSAAGATFTDVTNLSVTITTLGRPVKLSLQSDGLGSVSRLTTDGESTLQFVRGSTSLNQLYAGNSNFSPPSSSFQHTDLVAAGTYTYKVQVKQAAGTAVSVLNTVLIAHED